MKSPCSFLFLLFFTVTISCRTAKINGQSPVAEPIREEKTASTPFVTWDKKMVELGAVKKGEKRTLFYEFTNTSGEKIQIDLVDACDCTTVDYSHSVIEPGQKSRLDVIFNSAEKDASETISINVIFKNTHPNGVPYIETVEYKYDLVK